MKSAFRLLPVALVATFAVAGPLAGQVLPLPRPAQLGDAADVRGELPVAGQDRRRSGHGSGR